MLVRQTEVDALRAALVGRGQVRVALDVLWPLWAAAAPRLVGTVHQAEGLLTALKALEGAGVLTLPVGAWDASTVPALPRSVSVPSARRAARERPWTRFPWCARMGWAASLATLSDAQFRDLVAVNDWLVRAAGAPGRVPVRYRSVELFGDEKRLEALARTGLFGQGRLSLDLLGCARIPAPLPAAPVGAGPDLLVVENSDTYWVAAEMLAGFGGHPVGAVAWGSGATFPSQVTALAVDVAGRGPVRGVVWYWGDLDPAGLMIAVGAATAGAAEGIPVRPAAGLWAAMVDRPLQDPGTVTWPVGLGRDWLGPELWDRLGAIRDGQGRIAQESVPPAALASWAADLAAA
ncbi:hypothetical protein I6A84_43605 [Frankia sp. CNm7]|uniref:Wadjet protein JetD C-terminal domain-containing protein n=1 Tax=Frankia nepalensis TaxID=1836974 RepID=A0A937RCQ7_9ACTN|nr:hypothetical protein [Frankia nepalensis]MBL7500563.1 hypothetical protein [Frankia nepalensis]MBL7509032.1 hypothetical protein [Frankia nepalensis]MBL7524750.1 hypothetical protein [Frankia nepalensis]MBL7627862.1 hypothetical protein [Frankia nepalensis]